MKIGGKLLTAAALLGLASTGALAQSNCSYIATGAVLTAAQWNACFAAKQNTLGYTPVNKAGDTMLGRLTMTPSTTSSAGINIAPGVAPTSPNNGDTWITTAGMFVRVNGVTVGPLVGATGGTLVVGTTPITSGTTPRVLYDNAGVLGEYPISGTGSVAMTSAPTFDASPVSLTQVSNGQVSFTVTNTSSGNASVAGFQAINDTVGGSTTFGTFGSNYSATAALTNRSVILSGSALSGIALWAQGADPIVFGVNNAESGRFDTTTGSLTLGVAAASRGVINFSGSTGGALAVRGPATGSGTLTLPAGTTDFSATGGASQVVLQTSSGGAFTVARLACSDLTVACITANQTITLSGDVTGSGTTGITTTLATAQPAVHTWALAQTFTVAPVFTDASGSRTALGLGTAATQATGTSGATIPFLNGNNTYSGTALHTGAAASTGSNGQATIGASSTAGAVVGGKGSSKDLTLANSAGTSVCDVATGTTTINCAALTLTTRLNSGSIDLATNATIGVMRGDTTTISCVAGVCSAVGGVATTIQVGVTTVNSGTDLYFLYNNAGSLGNRTIASVLTAGTGIAITGTTNATITNSGVVTVKKQVFLTSGTYTPSTGMLYAIIECVGGGGGGAGSDGTATGLTSGGGGGGGSYARILVTAATIGASKTVTIGAGGGGGAAGPNNGSAGADSCVTGTSCVSAQICTGKGGGAGSQFGQATGGGGGAGGVAGTGDYSVSGNSGEAGLGASIATLIAAPARGGPGYWGGQFQVNIVGTASSAAGYTAGANTGAGGGGGISNATTTDAAGGTGGSGVILITEFNSQ